MPSSSSCLGSTTPACALRDALAPMGIEIRAGVHTAEIERRGDDISGIGVNIASRVADPGAVWVSRTVTDLVAGCGLAFQPRGETSSKGCQIRGPSTRWPSEVHQLDSRALRTHRVGMPATMAVYDEPVRRTTATATATAISGGMA